ncbi:hypothetical protein BESB_047590 [Besnoitia besnoiti]|uniref:Uncharacterized protein n=1 Tax=Besnoitia besnoiti TaxID=94643 RepID=A0A2A9MLM9_BESBE|nr:hypothetical protein BESB_047590 [Besnoitia besnoiti]PFH36567.1 hypothetical protein BESB_047590 [Besnoitia besnoiti]
MRSFGLLSSAVADPIFVSNRSSPAATRVPGSAPPDLAAGIHRRRLLPGFRHVASLPLLSARQSAPPLPFPQLSCPSSLRCLSSSALVLPRRSATPAPRGSKRASGVAAKAVDRLAFLASSGRPTSALPWRSATLHLRDHLDSLELPLHAPAIAQAFALLGCHRPLRHSPVLLRLLLHHVLQKPHAASAVYAASNEEAIRRIVQHQVADLARTLSLSRVAASSRAVQARAAHELSPSPFEGPDALCLPQLAEAGDARDGEGEQRTWRGGASAGELRHLGNSVFSEGDAWVRDCFSDSDKRRILIGYRQAASLRSVLRALSPFLYRLFLFSAGDVPSVAAAASPVPDLWVQELAGLDGEAHTGRPTLWELDEGLERERTLEEDIQLLDMLADALAVGAGPATGAKGSSLHLAAPGGGATLTRSDAVESAQARERALADASQPDGVVLTHRDEPSRGEEAARPRGSTDRTNVSSVSAFEGILWSFLERCCERTLSSLERGEGRGEQEKRKTTHLLPLLATAASTILVRLSESAERQGPLLKQGAPAAKTAPDAGLLHSPSEASPSSWDVASLCRLQRTASRVQRMILRASLPDFAHSDVFVALPASALALDRVQRSVAALLESEVEREEGEGGDALEGERGAEGVGQRPVAHVQGEAPTDLRGEGVASGRRSDFWGPTKTRREEFQGQSEERRALGRALNARLFQEADRRAADATLFADDVVDCMNTIVKVGWARPSTVTVLLRALCNRTDLTQPHVVTMLAGRIPVTDDFSAEQKEDLAEALRLLEASVGLQARPDGRRVQTAGAAVSRASSMSKNAPRSRLASQAVAADIAFFSAADQRRNELAGDSAQAAAGRMPGDDTQGTAVKDTAEDTAQVAAYLEMIRTQKILERKHRSRISWSTRRW